MENFDVNSMDNRTIDHSGDKLDMTVSPICVRDRKKIAYISFSDGVRIAEGEIPACIITKYDGFDQGEVAQLELYMKSELANLKKMAASVNVMDAFMKK